MFLDPVDNDTKHNKTLKQTAGLDVGVLIREVRIMRLGICFIVFTYLRCSHSYLIPPPTPIFALCVSLIGSEW